MLSILAIIFVVSALILAALTPSLLSTLERKNAVINTLKEERDKLEQERDRLVVERDEFRFLYEMRVDEDTIDFLSVKIGRLIAQENRLNNIEDDLACLDRCYMQTLYEAGED